MVYPSVDDEARVISRLRWHAFLVLIPAGVLAVLGCWYGSIELQRRFGMEQTAANQLAGFTSAAPALVLGWLLWRWTGGGKRRLTPRVRWLLSEKSLAFERHCRPWMALLTILLALPYVLELIQPGVGTRSWPANWSLLTIALPCFSLLTPTAKTGLSDEGLGAERSDAIRLGYMVVIALGVIACVVDNYRPELVARCWPLIVILGILVPQIRLIMLDQRVSLEDPDDTR